MSNQTTLFIMRDFVASHAMAVLTTIDELGLPWGAAVYIGSDNEFNLYFTTKSKTEKSRSIKHNPVVSVVFVDEPKQATLQLRGTARLINNAQEAQVASDAVRGVSIKSEDWMPPIAKINAGDYELYKITVELAKLRIFGDRRKGEIPREWDYKA